MPPAQVPPVRINHEGAIITDGPFTETKEVIGGFYAIEAENMDEAVTYGTSIQNGDSVQCRLYHVTAATLDSRTHCSHAAGVALCVDSDAF